MEAQLIWKDSKGNQYSKIGNKIRVRLKGEPETKKSREIFEIDLKNEVLITRRTYDKHLFRKGNAYGFNYEVLTKSKTCKHVLLTDDFGTYKIPISVIKNDGSFMIFNQLELQIFLEIPKIYEFKI